MSIVKTITDAFRGEFGTAAKRNPWPRCPGCWHRTSPAGWCDGGCGMCALCCSGCKKRDDDPDDEETEL